MRLKITWLLLGAVALTFAVLGGCGGSGGSNGGDSSSATVTGTASSGDAYVGAVTLKDYRGRSKSTFSSNTGTYSFDVSALTAPFFINAGNFYSMATSAGIVNVNPFTDVVARSAAGSNNIATVFTNLSSSRAVIGSITANLPTAQANFNTQMASLYEKYGMTTPPDFIRGSITIDKGVDLLFKDIKVTVSGTNVNITNTAGATLMSGSFSGALFQFTPNMTNIAALPGIPGPTIPPGGTTGSCDSGFVTTSKPEAQAMCGTRSITACVATSATSPIIMYYLVGGTNRINYSVGGDLNALTMQLVSACTQ